MDSEAESLMLSVDYPVQWISAGLVTKYRWVEGA